MGCAHSNSSTSSSPNGLQKLKMENGYVPKRGLAGHRRSTGQKYSGTRKNNSDPPPPRYHKNGSGRDGKLSLDKKDSPTSTLEIDAEDDQVVNGWPKWLTDNVPAEVLANLVPKSAENYDKIDKVGQGTYSNVYKARDRDTGKIVALKKVKFDTSEAESVKFMAREITILQKLDHPNVVKLEGLATSRMQYSLYLVFDFMQSDLSSIINNPDSRLTEPQVKCYMQQLLSGLQHCHERGILHRDIKGSNLLIDKNGMLKIADFGLANYYNPKRPLTSRVVTLWYRAPELLLGSTNYGFGIDLWSAGCLLAEMLAARPIMPGRTEVEQLHRIFKLCGTPSEEYWKKLKLSTTFRPPKQYKPSLFEAFGEFPESSLGLLTTLLALDPAYRGSASSALQSEFFYMSPFPCDLSGLPVIWREEDEIAQANELRKHRSNSKMKRRSRTYREQRSRQVLNETPVPDSTNSEKETEHIEKPKTQSQEAAGGGSSSGSSTSGRAGELSPVPIWKQKMSPKSQGLPPLPGYNKSNSSNKYSNESFLKMNQMQRSASTREYRKRNQRQHLQLYALEN
ncbi:Cyclin-dependent kinase C-2 C [Euphorbia peplus]|nr:Cyclin-dependent kinase C-2 C [Euphorbia peplus]